MPKEETISWYHGKLSREDAEKLVRGLNVEGGFLVRESVTSPGDYVLTVLHNTDIVHYQILQHGEDAFFSIDQEHILHGLESLVAYHQDSENGLITKLTVFCKKDPPPHDSRCNGRTNLLHRATKEGNYMVVSELLKCGYRSLDAKNEEGQTAAHLASRLGDDAILVKLIESGANMNCRDTAGYTPLHYASQSDHAATVHLLVEQGGALVQNRNADNGWVALHEAACLGHTEVVRLLLSLNAPAHPRTPRGETPVMLALANGHVDCVEILRHYKAPTPVVSKQQFYHGTLDRQEAVDLLTEHGNKEGSYLVRYSNKSGGIYVLTMVVDNWSYHFQVKHENDFFFIDDGPLLDSLEHVVDYYSKMQDGLPTILKTPVPPKPKPPVPDFPRCGLSATMPLKRRSPKINMPNLSSGVGASLDGHHTTGRRSSTPLIVSTDRKGSVGGAANPWQGEGCIHVSRVKLGKVLGEGEFGTVYRGTYHTDDNTVMEVAIKTLHNEHLALNRNEFLREAKVMTNLNHHCVVKLIGLCQGPPLMMVQELVLLGSMLAYLLEFPDRINPNYDLRVWASQIACGMNYLEEQRFVHRDLAARNILLSSKHQAKISDFGLSRVISEDQYYYKATVGGRWPIKWYAPESFNFGTFSHASDVWSFGVTLWEMFSFGAQPYGDMKGTEVIKLVEGGDRLEKPEKCPADVYKVMEQCWNMRPADRLTFKQLLEIFHNTDPEYINVKALVIGHAQS